MEKPKTNMHTLPASDSRKVNESVKYNLRSKLKQNENMLTVENNNIVQTNADASQVWPQKEEVKKEPLKSQNDNDKLLQPDGNIGLLKIDGPKEPSRINPCDGNFNVYEEPDKNVRTPKSENPNKPESRPVFDVSQKRKSSNHTENIKWQSFSAIKENVYVAPLRKSQSLRSKDMIDNVCYCTENCKDPCLHADQCCNRASCVECDPETCLAKDKCLNQRFAKQYPPLEVRHFAERGHGLVTLANLVKNQFVIEYIGEVINNAELERRKKHMTERKESNFYFMKLDKGMNIDGKRKGNLARFINHSCNPNCEAFRWNVNKRPVIGIQATKDINQNEELTIDYTWKDFALNTPCLCGAEKCSGKVG